MSVPVPSPPPAPAHPVLAASTGWYNSFHNLIDHATTLAIGALGLVIVVIIVMTLQNSKGSIAKVVMAGLTGSVAFWLALHYKDNATRTDQEVNSAPAVVITAGSPVHHLPDVGGYGRSPLSSETSPWSGA